jgi:hypothetical protein
VCVFAIWKTCPLLEDSTDGDMVSRVIVHLLFIAVNILHVLINVVKVVFPLSDLQLLLIIDITFLYQQPTEMSHVSSDLVHI